jgi:RNA polymerase sigma factor for flagellar operon FliA
MSSLPSNSLSNYRQPGYVPPGKNRDALIEAHLPHVKYVAERLAAKLPPWVDINDLIGAGMLGLLDAVDKFDPSKGVMFKTYAEMRVRGAILDSLRDLDWAPRSMRRRAREVEAAYQQVERTKGHATEVDVAAVLGIPVSEFQTLLGELRGLTVMELDAVDEDVNGGGASYMLADTRNTPLALYETAEVRECLTRSVDRLPERERQVVALYYVEELTMKEIGAVLGVTESRVSQIHTQAMIRLRNSLAPLRSSLATV